MDVNAKVPDANEIEKVEDLNPDEVKEEGTNLFFKQ